jgi:hypothetical protein
LAALFIPFRPNVDWTTSAFVVLATNCGQLIAWNQAIVQPLSCYFLAFSLQFAEITITTIFLEVIFTAFQHLAWCFSWLGIGL